MLSKEKFKQHLLLTLILLTLYIGFMFAFVGNDLGICLVLFAIYGMYDYSLDYEPKIKRMRLY